MMWRKKRSHQNIKEEIEAAKQAAEESAEEAQNDVEIQRKRLDEERSTIIPMIRQMHSQNHVADAIIRVIEGRQ